MECKVEILIGDIVVVEAKTLGEISTSVFEAFKQIADGIYGNEKVEVIERSQDNKITNYYKIERH